MQRLGYLLIYLICSSVAAQVSFKVDQTIPVETAGVALDLAWAGGLNSAEYNTLDLNNDGKDDLVIFDRMARKIVTFLNVNNTWQYAPDFESYFPTVANWLLIRDFNCDGKKDIFTGDVLGIRVYQNIQSGKIPAWKALKFYASGSTKSDVLLTKGFSGKINIQLQYDDLPAIGDADGDGDVDVFNMRFVGGSIEYHKNLSKEKYGTCDSLEFERMSQAWGGVRDCYCGNFAFNDSQCASGGRLQHAVGKSLLYLDANNDQKPDMQFSEAECPTIFTLANDGSADAPAIAKSFPFIAANTNTNFSYPAAYFEDVDFDGKKDIVVSSNLFAKDDPEEDYGHSSILFKNQGTNVSPVLTLAQNNFLQDRMIDVGDNAVPAFADIDTDGDYDMFVSSNSSENMTSRIWFFENTGDKFTPRFNLISDDYLNFSTRNFNNVKIQFADVNNDGSTDLAFTGTDLATSDTQLYYIRNKSKNGFDFSDATPIDANFQINYAENVFLTDVDGDGTLDALAGRTNGQLEVWLNSSSTALDLSIADDDFLQLNTSGLNQTVSAFVADIDNDNNEDLLYSDGNGKLFIVLAFRARVNSSGRLEKIIVNDVSGELMGRNIGVRTTVTAVNLFHTTKPSIIVGTALGGLSLLRNTDNQKLAGTAVEVFPNPVSTSQALNIRTDKPARVEIYSSIGKLVGEPFVVAADRIHEYSTASLQGGVYVFKFHFENETVVKRIIFY